MREVAAVGLGMHPWGKFADRSLTQMCREAVEAALTSCGVEKQKLDAAAVGNAMAGLITGQECIRGQVVLRDMGIGGIPVINTENACASACSSPSSSRARSASSCSSVSVINRSTNQLT